MSTVPSRESCEDRGAIAWRACALPRLSPGVRPRVSWGVQIDFGRYRMVSAGLDGAVARYVRPRVKGQGATTHILAGFLTYLVAENFSPPGNLAAENLS